MQPSAADILTLGYVLRLNCQPAASSTRKTDNTLIRGEKVMKEPGMGDSSRESTRMSISVD